MSPSKQNLFLFLEENEDQSIIDNKLVKLYMNRCIINDGANFEIAGVYELQKVTEPILSCSNPLFKANASQRTYKKAVDLDILIKALEKTSLRETNSTDNHFIIGSSFHPTGHNCRNDTQPLNWLDKLIDWLENELKSHGMRSLYVTVLSGSRCNLVTKEMHMMMVNDSELVLGYKMTQIFCECETKTGPLPSISVNDDFELSIELIQRGRRLENTIPLFLHPKLNSDQLKLMEANDESFLQSFINHIMGGSADVSKVELKNFPDSDPRLRYMNCFCLRQSFHLKST